MTGKNSDAIDRRAILSSKLCLALWKHINQRLHRKGRLITDNYFFKVMQGEIPNLAYVAPYAAIMYAIRAMVYRVNQENPNKHLIFDIKHDT